MFKLGSPKQGLSDPPALSIPSHEKQSKNSDVYISPHSCFPPNPGTSPWGPAWGAFPPHRGR